jgi:hypothetical protein
MKFQNILYLAMVVAMWFAGSATVMAQESAERSPAAGSWKFMRESLAGNVKCVLHLKEKDGKLQGTYSDAEQVKATVKGITVQGDQISIQLVFDENRDATVTLSGKIEGNSIVGKMIDAGEEVEWKAQKFVSLQEAAGKWRMSFVTPDGMERKPEFTLADKDGKPVVEFVSGEGEAAEADDAKMTKTEYRDGLLLFHVSMEFEGQDLKLEYELEFETADTLIGSMYFEFGGADMSGDVDVEGERIQ